MTRTANQDQIDYWNSNAGQTWTRNQTRMDKVLAPTTEAVLTVARAQAGEHILDIGCGCGDTTLSLARTLNGKGSVVGLDISAPMLARTRERFREAGLDAELIEADAATYSFEARRFDLVLSRFGVMFFDDPAAAFANIRKGMARDGRLAFVCWRNLLENEWMLKPLAAALAHVEPPEPPAPNAPGPLAFADPTHVRGLLSDAGFNKIDIAPLDVELVLADAGDDAIEEAATFTLEIGPLARLLKEKDVAPETRDRIVDAVRGEFRKHMTEKGVSLKGACWLVTAHA